MSSLISAVHIPAPPRKTSISVIDGRQNGRLSSKVYTTHHGAANSTPRDEVFDSLQNPRKRTSAACNRQWNPGWPWVRQPKSLPTLAAFVGTLYAKGEPIALLAERVRGTRIYSVIYKNH